MYGLQITQTDRKWLNNLSNKYKKGKTKPKGLVQCITIIFLFGTGVTPVAPLHLIGQLGLTRDLRVWQLSMQDHWRIQGGAPGTRAPPGGPNSFIFMQFSAKMWKIIAILGVGAPPWGKSWIRHWRQSLKHDRLCVLCATSQLTFMRLLTADKPNEMSLNSWNGWHFLVR